LTENISSFPPEVQDAIQEALLTRVDFGGGGGGGGGGGDNNRQGATVVEGETVGGTGGVEDPNNRVNQALNRFLEANDIATGQINLFTRNDGTVVLVNSEGKTIGTYNAATGEFER
jgi:hypothetical protein